MVNMQPEQLRKMAERSGWNVIATKNKNLASFVIGNNNTSKKRIRINVYWTTGTVGICIPHRKEKFVKKQTKFDIDKLFQTIPEGM